MNDETLYSAFENWEVLSTTPEQVLAYESRLKRVLDEEAAIREAELRQQEAHEEGIKDEKKSTARRLLVEGFDVRMVARLTELDEERVIEIQQAMNQSQ